KVTNHRGEFVELPPFWITGNTNASLIGPEEWQFPDEATLLATANDTFYYQVENLTNSSLPNEGKCIKIVSMVANNSWDLAWMDNRIEDVLRHNQGAQIYLFPRLGLYLYSPPLRMFDRTAGTYIEDVGVGSMGSSWLENVRNNVSNIIDHLNENYPGYIMGYHIGGQQTDEWFYPTLAGDHIRYPNYSDDFVSIFSARYPGMGVPSADERDSIHSDLYAGGVGYSPFNQFSDANGYVTHTVLYNQFLNERTPEAIDAIAEKIKSKTHQNVLVSAFYGYIMELVNNRLVLSGHQAVGEMLRKNNVDILMSPVSYKIRELGESTTYQGPLDSFQLQDTAKLWITEDDSWTHLGLGATLKQYTDTLSGTINLLTRDFLSHFIHGNGMYLFDLYLRGNWGKRSNENDSQAIFRTVRNLRGIYSSYMTRFRLR
ncbi:MAG: hypothetical protein P8123_09620, partial [bacterium]